MIEKIKDVVEFKKIIDLSSYAFNMPVSEATIARNTALLAHTENWGLYEGDALTSQIIVLPYQVNLHNTEFSMAGIGNVASYPDYRGSGSINQLFKEIFEELKNNQTILSYLNPFNQEFYRKYGYELIFNRAETVISQTVINQLPTTKKGSIRRVDKKDSVKQGEVKSLYAQTLQKDDGSLIRNEWWWQQSFDFDEKKILAISYNEEQKANGYLFYQMKQTEMVIDELVYTSKESLYKLLGFIGSHQATFKTFRFVKDTSEILPLLFADNWEVKQTILPWMMVKIISFEGLISKLSFNQSGTDIFYLGVRDEYSPWNTGTWQVTLKDGQGQAELIDTDLTDKVDISGSIQTWTQLLLDSNSVKNLKLLGRVSLLHPERGELFLKSIKKTELGLHDHF